MGNTESSRAFFSEILGAHMKLTGFIVDVSMIFSKIVLGHKFGSQDDIRNWRVSI
jgi:hypothetical protein